jgi:hypothetical protein
MHEKCWKLGVNIGIKVLKGGLRDQIYAWTNQNTDKIAYYL